jgi:glycerol-3-phosphate dehydrogenase (NAD(P)+)
VIGVVGAGAFGTALAVAEASAGREVRLWARSPEAVRAMTAGGENRRLPGVRLPSGVRPTSDLADLAGAEAVLLAVPAQQTDAFLAMCGAALPEAPLVLCAKGIAGAGLRRQTEIAAARLPRRDAAVLTGPGFAAEIARGLPTALTLAATAAVGHDLQARLSTPRLRLYLTDDLIGAELGGALKNVVALACGMVEGAALGHSARAALMTRGFAEMVRLAVAMGARGETLTGLSGLGDLSLTCNSGISRNFALGRALGAGAARAEGVTVEGVATAAAACELGDRHGVELPIAVAVDEVLAGRLTVAGAMDRLLARPLREE